MGVTQAEDFLRRCFQPEETIALLLRREKPVRVIQRIVRIEQAAAPAYLRWLAYENANRFNVYVAANPLLQGSRKRTKECIAEVRHLYLDMDCDGDTRVAAVCASNAVPKPTAIISTSPGKYQVLWRVEGFGLEQQEHMLKLLSQTFGGDSACTDCNRVIRVPGFHNTKYTPAYPVTVEYLSGSAAKPEDFRLSESSPFAVLPLRGTARPAASPKRTHSEQDWAWTLAELTKGRDAAELTRALAFRRADKPILSTTPSARLTSHSPVSHCSVAPLQKLWFPCWNIVALRSSHLRFAPLAPER